MSRRLLSFLTTTLFLVLTGSVEGLVVSVLGLALNSAFKSLQSSSGEGLMDFLVDLFFLLIDVLAVSTIATTDGLWVGVISAAAISLSYGIILAFLPQRQPQRWGLALLFAIVGAIAAALSVRGALADDRVAATVGGALFGLIAGLALSKRQGVAP